MLEHLKNEANTAFTENGAVTYKSTMSDCLDLFAAIGAIRNASAQEITDRFLKAYAENPDIAMKILFFGRDIRGGLGERRVFRIIAGWLAEHEPDSIRRNIELIPEYGRFDDLLSLLGTACEKDALRVIGSKLERDIKSEAGISLLAKWLPSVNASNGDTVRNAKKIARYLGMSDAQYRRTLTKLRKKIRIIENNLREKDYSFDYSAQPSKAMFKYRKAFARNDMERYTEYLDKVNKGVAAMHTGALMPYEIIEPCFDGWRVFNNISESERLAMDTAWNALENFGTDENAIVVVDGSGSMYDRSRPAPITVALSLGIYFAQCNTGAFHNHFITFSERPRLVEIKGRDIVEKVRYCAKYDEVANTNLRAVFELILRTAVKHSVKQEDMPSKLYIISDMEFDVCVTKADVTNFDYARKIFAAHGYKLPEIVFWNVNSRNIQQPVRKNEKGVALVSGCTPRLFSMVTGGATSPYDVMTEIINSERYAPVSA